MIKNRMDEFLSDLIDDYDSFTEEYKGACRDKLKKFIIDLADDTGDVDDLITKINEL